MINNARKFMAMTVVGVFTIFFMAMAVVGIYNTFNLCVGKAFVGHQGPPPEADTICEGKSVADAAGFESPHGNRVTGTCVADVDRLFLCPDNLPNG